MCWGSILGPPDVWKLPYGTRMLLTGHLEFALLKVPLQGLFSNSEIEPLSDSKA